MSRRSAAATPRAQSKGMRATPPPARHRSISSGTSGTSATVPDAVFRLETLLEEAPHAGREAEYESVIAYVSRRLSHETNTSLFVCGGCGCGKTSTVKRALRAMSARVLPCDAKARRLVKHSTLEESGWGRSSTGSDGAATAIGNDNRPSREEHPIAYNTTPRSSEQLQAERGRSPSSTNGPTPPSSSSSQTALLSLTTSPETTLLPASLLNATTWSKCAVPGLISPESSRPSVSSVDSTATMFAAAGLSSSVKRCRAADELEENSSCPADVDRLAVALFTQDAGRRQQAEDLNLGASQNTQPVPYSLDYFKMRYPELFSHSCADGKASSPLKSTIQERKVLGHYINCADVSGPALIEAVQDSIRATCTRTDSATRLLLEWLTCIGNTASSRSNATRGEARESYSASKSVNSRHRAALPTLHVVALDEVEYLRGGGAKTLTQLAEVAFQNPSQLALIFISNQRAFVHVPQMMLEPLLFQPYDEARLREIGARVTYAELQRCEQLFTVDGCRRSRSTSSKRSPGGAKVRKVAAHSSAADQDHTATSQVDIKPRLFDYIARKALLEFSGDVRQVIAMCHRVVSVAWQEVTEARSQTSVEAAGKASALTATAQGNRNAAVMNKATLADLPSKLEATIDTYSNSKSTALTAQAAQAPAGIPRLSSDAAAPNNASRRSSGAARGSLGPSMAALMPVQATSPSSSSGVMTLAKTVSVLQSNQVESHIDKHIGTLPEQTLYVLSCIVVLTLRKQEERTYASSSVGGRIGTARTPGAGVSAAQRAAPTLSLKMHEAHQLYTRLMSKLHFPAMRADGFPVQVDCLADFGVLTRPQQRGNDRVFSLNGTWTLSAMQAALVKRGEVIKKDRMGAGAMMENRFEEVLRELANLLK